MEVMIKMEEEGVETLEGPGPLELASELDDIKSKGLHRTMVPFSSRKGPFTVYAGKEMLDLSTNDYLGLATDEEVVEAYIDAVKTYGTGSTGSRLLSGDADIHERLELELARLKGKEAAILFPTGYQANVGLFAALGPRFRYILSDELNHASIISGIRSSRTQKVVYPHMDMEVLKSALGDTDGANSLIATDGIFSMDGDIAPLPKIVELANDNGSSIMVDDAHATGVLGERGGGTAQHFGLEKYVNVQMGTLSKALGSIGGFVAGSAELVDYLRNTSKAFIYSTGLPPANAAAALKALERMKDPRIRASLWKNVSMVRQGLEELGFELGGSGTPILPVMVGNGSKAMDLANRLVPHGIFARAIRWPSVPKDSARLRINVCANWDSSMVQHILGSMEVVGKVLKVIA